MTDATTNAAEEVQKTAEQADTIQSGESSTTEAPSAATAPVQPEISRESAEKLVEPAVGVHAEAERTPLSRVSPSHTSRSSSRAAERGRHSNPPDRLDTERHSSGTPNTRSQPHGPNRLPRHAEARLPMRPDLLDNRRDRRHDFHRGGRYNDLDHSRSFDQSTNETRNHGRLDREFPARPLADEQLRAPSYRDGRGPRDPSWPERSGRLRAPESFQGRPELDRTTREGPPGPRSGPSTHPDRMDLIEDRPDRMGDGRRGEMPRPEKNDRRSLPSTLSSPKVELPNRPERFPGEDRRSANFTQPSPRRDDLPTGPRSDRPPRGPMEPPSSVPDMNHGRLRLPEPPSDIPLGPRGRNASGRGGRSMSGVQHPSQSPFSSPSGPMERQPPTGPGRQGMRNVFDQSSPAAAMPSAPEPIDTSGIHPDRLKVMQQQQPNEGGYKRSHQPPGPPIVPPSGPRNTQTPSAGPSPITRGPPSGSFGGERGRGDKRFAGINNMLQQSLGPADRGPGTTIRGRGANRAMNAPSPQATRPQTPASVAEDSDRPTSTTQGRPDLMAGRSGSHADTEGHSRSRGGRTELIDGAASEPRRPLRQSSSSNFPDRERDRERERERRGDEEGRSSGRRDEYRERTGTRDFERERSRRSEGSANVSREERHESRESARRGGGVREENRRRERRERDEGPEAGHNSHEHEGRLRPPSSLGVVPPPPPPPPPFPPGPGPQNDRRWSGGHDRDRERTRMRDRDYNRDNAPHRKRGRPGGDEGGAMRQGGENKRPRRGV